MKKILMLLMVFCLCLAAVFAFGSCDANEGENPDASNGDADHVHSFTVESATDAYLKSAATCTEKAVYYKSCACGEAGEETFAYGELGNHIFDRMTVDAKYFVSAATCTSAASYKYSCLCGLADEQTFTHGEMLPHDYDGCVCTACGYEKSSDGLIFEYNDWHGAYTVVGYEGELAEELYIANTYNGSPVSGIGNGAFKNCTSIKRVYISDVVQNIAQEAFFGCKNLESVSIGKGVSSIGWYAFTGCAALESIEISKENQSLAAIGNCVLADETVCYEDGTEEIITVLVVGCKKSVIPQDANITFIRGDAFYGVKGLTSVVIPDTVRQIDVSAFDGCTDLKNLTIGKGIKYLNNYAFANCTALETIYYNVIDMITIGDDTIFMNAGIDGEGVTLTIGKDVAIIPDDLFSGSYIVEEERYTHHKITDVVFEDGCVLETIGRRAFEDAIYLRSLVIPDSVKLIYEHAFKGCAAMTSLTIGHGVNAIPESCFEECSSLKNILLGDVTDIGLRAFAACTELEYLSLPEGIVTIGGGAFSECKSLRYVGIPNTVSLIDYAAFAYCDALSEIYFNAPCAPDFYDTSSTDVFAFSGINGNGVSVIIGKDVVRIPAYFADRLDIYAVSWEAGTTCESIGEYAFSDCRRLLDFTLPASLKEVADNAFSGYVIEVYNFSDIDVSTIESLAYGVLCVHTSSSSASKLMYDGDFVFFVNGDDRRLVCYRGDELSLTLPESCNGEDYAINQHAFYFSPVRNLVIPAGVTEIGFGAFENSSLETVTIQNGVDVIRQCAFDTPSLKSVIVPSSVSLIESKAFTGAADIFCEISSKPSSWPEYTDPELVQHNFYGRECTVYWYSDAAPTTEGNYWHYVGGKPTAW